MSTGASNAMVKREGEVEQRVVFQAGGAAAADQAASSTQRDDSSKFITVMVEKDRWLHCTACSGPLKPPVYKVRR
jgi:hypothetical protein